MPKVRMEVKHLDEKISAHRRTVVLDRRWRVCIIEVARRDR
ncbi:hypothetical protein [Pseudomonas phage S50]|uniref:Uncharacterized protein n=2 Tax=Pbunavirus TaxID=1198980 RepID=A0A455XGQ1_9CAUD|nr:hypothetical protein PALZ7_03 [Pseudomonas phage PA_LZ7]WRY57270.1 hypothetical protein [Pseudomonas phage vB_PaeM_SIIA-P1]BBJ26913.1 hypothetical protein [Pseudomonas phage S50]